MEHLSVPASPSPVTPKALPPGGTPASLRCNGTSSSNEALRLTRSTSHRSCELPCGSSDPLLPHEQTAPHGPEKARPVFTAKPSSSTPRHPSARVRRLPLRAKPFTPGCQPPHRSCEALHPRVSAASPFVRSPSRFDGSAFLLGQARFHQTVTRVPVHASRPTVRVILVLVSMHASLRTPEPFAVRASPSARRPEPLPLAQDRSPPTVGRSPVAPTRSGVRPIDLVPSPKAPARHAERPDASNDALASRY